MVESPWLGIGISGFPEKPVGVIQLPNPLPISSPEIEAPCTTVKRSRRRLLGLQYLHGRAHSASAP